MNNPLRSWGRKSTTTIVSALVCLLAGSISYADPVTHTITELDTDWTSAGVGGAGGGSGTITLSGITGSIDTARLYWHGIDSGGNSDYDNATVSINGNSVTGTAIGAAATNCWGPGNSVAYRADVSSFVSGDGGYAITGLSNGTGHSGNGASLVVTFNDGNSSNNRDVAFFEGNDSDAPDNFPGEDIGWHATLNPVNYDGSGTVNIQFHASDGQNAGDGPVTLTTAEGSVTFQDDATLWDGFSVPDAGTGRGNHGLWDIHTFDITSAFGGVSGSGISLDLDGQDSGGDCLGLVLALVDFPPNSLPPLEPQGPQEPVTVPTLSTWSIILMIVMLALLGMVAHRRMRA